MVTSAAKKSSRLQLLKDQMIRKLNFVSNKLFISVKQAFLIFLRRIEECLGEGICRLYSFFSRKLFIDEVFFPCLASNRYFPSVSLLQQHLQLSFCQNIQFVQNVAFSNDHLAIFVFCSCQPRNQWRYKQLGLLTQDI